VKKKNSSKKCFSSKSKKKIFFTSLQVLSNSRFPICYCGFVTEFYIGFLMDNIACVSLPCSCTCSQDLPVAVGTTTTQPKNTTQPKVLILPQLSRKKVLILTLKLLKLALFAQIWLKKGTTPAVLGKTLDLVHNKYPYTKLKISTS
jgi:hypothetical protein